ncbi:hypothetical protein [Streptomyces orinoci]|uniref:Secreted protein n=1 Tax=Streptomyces orinoci TaxID=67339 RepID=A0ABV3K581_STRON|nr:hypothetical protein [Streptomyces orinoci]
MTARRSLAPHAALTGFVLLLAMVFGAAYAAGSAAGPVAPGMHRTGGGSAPAPGSGSGNGGGGSHDMPGMDH